MHLKQNACFTLESRARGAATTSHFKAQPTFLADGQAGKPGTAPESPSSSPPAFLLHLLGSAASRRGRPHAQQRRSRRCWTEKDARRVFHVFYRKRLLLRRGAFRPLPQGRDPWPGGRCGPRGAAPTPGPRVSAGAEHLPAKTLLTYNLGAKTAFPFRRRDALGSRAGVATGAPGGLSFRRRPVRSGEGEVGTGTPSPIAHRPRVPQLLHLRSAPTAAAPRGPGSTFGTGRRGGPRRRIAPLF